MADALLIRGATIYDGTGADGGLVGTLDWRADLVENLELELVRAQRRARGGARGRAA